MKQYSFALALAFATCFAASSANAVVISNTYQGVNDLGLPEVTFDSLAVGTTPSGVLSPIGATITGNGIIANGTSSNSAAPANDTTNYLAILGGKTATLSFASVQTNFGFLLGSADTYNTFVFFNGSTQVGSFNGGQLLNPGNGNQFSPLTNGYVTFTGDFTSVVLGSSQNSLELDNITVSAVPEPSTWAMLLLGFAGVGLFGYRQNRKSNLRVLGA